MVGGCTFVACYPGQETEQRCTQFFLHIITGAHSIAGGFLKDRDADCKRGTEKDGNDQTDGLVRLHRLLRNHRRIHHTSVRRLQAPGLFCLFGPRQEHVKELAIGFHLALQFA